jgi:ribosomal protein S27AE
MLLRHEGVLLAQTQQAAPCNATHRLEARLCRWILRACDVSGEAMLSATQEDIAEALGVRRASISTVAHTMQKLGLLKYRRGRIEVLDVEAMRRSACECYTSVAGHYDRLSCGRVGTEGPQPMTVIENALSA